MVGFPRLCGSAYNRLTYLLAEQILWQGFRPIVNRWRRETLDLPPTPWRGYMDQLGTERIPILNGFSSHVVPHPQDWGPHVHVTGYWFPEDRTWQPPDDLRAFVEAGPPPVFIGLGSMPVRDPEKTVRIVLEALRQSGQRGILHAGWGGLRAEALPPEVFAIDYAPYDWLFPRMAMIVHHGGSGTTAFGLGAGVPCCALPMLFDQFMWGRRIAALGVGPAPIPFRQLTVDRLAEAIDRGVHDGQMRAESAALGARIREERGTTRAIEIIGGTQNQGG
jgi:UDP:flavonoid glycosyltransferase YjiC (YdhE family)